MTEEGTTTTNCGPITTMMIRWAQHLIMDGHDLSITATETQTQVGMVTICNSSDHSIVITIITATTSSIIVKIMEDSTAIKMLLPLMLLQSKMI